MTEVALVLLDDECPHEMRSIFPILLFDGFQSSSNLTNSGPEEMVGYLTIEIREFLRVAQLYGIEYEGNMVRIDVEVGADLMSVWHMLDLAGWNDRTSQFCPYCVCTKENAGVSIDPISKTQTKYESRFAH